MIEIGCPPTLIALHCTNSLPPYTPRRHTPAAPLLHFPHPLLRHRVVAVKPALSRARSQCPNPTGHIPFLLLRPPLLSLFCRASRSPRRGNPHAHDASPSYARRSHSRSAVTIALSLLVPDDLRQCLRMAICHAWYQAVDACNGPFYLNDRDHARVPSISFPSSTPPYAAAHHQERGPAGVFLRSSLSLPLFRFPSLPPAFLPQVRVCVNANDAFVAQVAGPEERASILDAICTRGREMMMHRFGSWAVQRCLEAATGPEERSKIVACMHSRIVYLATNCYGYYLLRRDPATTLPNKYASHVCNHGALVYPTGTADLRVRQQVPQWQRGFENLEESAKDGIVDELLGQSSNTLENHRQIALDHLLTGLLKFAMNEQGSTSVVKALKEGGKEMLERVVQHMCEPAKGFILLPTFLSFSRLALPVPLVGDQRAALYDCIRVDIVTLRGRKIGSKAIWLFDRMRLLRAPNLYSLISLRLHDRFKL
ncbi:hypothetical protein B0H13DRAFT_2568446 [Mycena leptocephala]|nr:hypothetical protein B0H13DRAFT_2568446 [Mycena leptocephala]